MKLWSECKEANKSDTKAQFKPIVIILFCYSYIANNR